MESFPVPMQFKSNIARYTTKTGLKWSLLRLRTRAGLSIILRAVEFDSDDMSERVSIRAVEKSNDCAKRVPSEVF